MTSSRLQYFWWPVEFLSQLHPSGAPVLRGLWRRAMFGDKFWRLWGQLAHCTRKVKCVKGVFSLLFGNRDCEVSFWVQLFHCMVPMINFANCESFMFPSADWPVTENGQSWPGQCWKIDNWIPHRLHAAWNMLKWNYGILGQNHRLWCRPRNCHKQRGVISNQICLDGLLLHSYKHQVFNDIFVCALSFDQILKSCSGLQMTCNWSCFERYNFMTINNFYNVDTPAPRNSWFHIAVVWYGKDVGFGVFHNGMFVRNSTHTPKPPGNTDDNRPLIFGRRFQTNFGFYELYSSIELDEFMIFRPAFTPEDVAQLYNRWLKIQTVFILESFRVLCGSVLVGTVCLLIHSKHVRVLPCLKSNRWVENSFQFYFQLPIIDSAKHFPHVHQQYTGNKIAQKAGFSKTDNKPKSGKFLPSVRISWITPFKHNQNLDHHLELHKPKLKTDHECWSFNLCYWTQKTNNTSPVQGNWNWTRTVIQEHEVECWTGFQSGQENWNWIWTVKLELNLDIETGSESGLWS